MSNDVPRRPAHPDRAEKPRRTPAARVLGGLGAAVIAVTLFGLRLWARITRTPYYRD